MRVARSKPPTRALSNTISRLNAYFIWSDLAFCSPLTDLDIARREGKVNIWLGLMAILQDIHRRNMKFLIRRDCPHTSHNAELSTPAQILTDVEGDWSWIECIYLEERGARQERPVRDCVAVEHWWDICRKCVRIKITTQKESLAPCIKIKICSCRGNGKRHWHEALNKVNRVNVAALQDFRLIYLSGCTRLLCLGLDSDARFQSGRECLHVLWWSRSDAGLAHHCWCIDVLHCHIGRRESLTFLLLSVTSRTRLSVV